jgi:hypothetical protein
VANIYPPMDVTIERDPDDPRMSGPVPGFDPTWSRIDQLRWKTGIIKARTGLTVNLNDGCKAGGEEWPEVIGVMVPGGFSTSQFDDRIDLYLRGLEDGAEAAMKLTATALATADDHRESRQFFPARLATQELLGGEQADD